MEGLTVNQLQQKCRDANLKTTGNKQTLIERLESHGPNNTTNADLVKRIRELEDTVARLNSVNISEKEEDEVQQGSPQTAVFTPRVVTSPQPINASAPQFSIASTPVSSAQYVPTCIPQYIPEGAPHLGYSRPPHMFTTVAPQVWQASDMPPVVNHVPTCVYPVPSVAAPFSHVTASVNVKDIIMMLPEFDPTAENSVSSKQFVQRVQVLKNAYHWPEDLLIFAVQQKLRGHAKYWIDAHDEVFVNWQQLAAKLMEAFPFNDNAADAHIEMANTTREANETPQEYYYRMVALGKKYSMTDNVIARHLINGINEPDLKKKISNDYQSCVELFRDIDSYCRFNKINNNTKANSQYLQNKINYNDGKKPQEQLFPRKQNIQAGGNQFGKHRQCYNCSQYGHVSTNCPNKIENVNIVEKKNKIKTITVNGLEVRCLVDTGADITIMKYSIFKKLDTTLNKSFSILRGLGNTKTKPIGEFVGETAVDGVIIYQRFIVVPDSALQYDALIGYDFIQKFCFKYDDEGFKFLIEQPATKIDHVEELEEEAVTDEEEITEQQQLRIDYELQLEQLRKEKEIERNEKESIMLKFANQEKLLIDTKKEKDVLKKKLIQAKRQIEEEGICDTDASNENKEDDIENEEEQDKVFDEDENEGVYEFTEQIVVEKNDEEDNTSQESAVKKRCESLHNEDKEKSKITTEDFLEELVTVVNAIQNDDRDEDSSVAVNDCFKQRHKFKEKINRLDPNC